MDDYAAVVWGIISIRADVIFTGIVIHTIHIYRARVKHKPKAPSCVTILPSCAYCKYKEVSPKLIAANTK